MLFYIILLIPSFAKTSFIIVSWILSFIRKSTFSASSTELLTYVPIPWVLVNRGKALKARIFKCCEKSCSTCSSFLMVLFSWILSYGLIILSTNQKSFCYWVFLRVITRKNFEEFKVSQLKSNFCRSEELYFEKLIRLSPGEKWMLIFRDRTSQWGA